MCMSVCGCVCGHLSLGAVCARTYAWVHARTPRPSLPPTRTHTSILDTHSPTIPHPTQASSASPGCPPKPRRGSKYTRTMRQTCSTATTIHAGIQTHPPNPPIPRQHVYHIRHSPTPTYTHPAPTQACSASPWCPPQPPANVVGPETRASGICTQGSGRCACGGGRGRRGGDTGTRSRRIGRVWRAQHHEREPFGGNR